MSLRIAITGSTGMIGSEVSRFFCKQGHMVTPFVRKETKWDSPEPTIKWDIKSKEVDVYNLDGHDVVIHLAGANIAGKKWTQKYKDLIMDSCSEGTEVISAAIAKLKIKPKVFFMCFRDWLLWMS